MTDFWWGVCVGAHLGGMLVWFVLATRWNHKGWVIVKGILKDKPLIGPILLVLCLLLWPFWLLGARNA